MNPEFVILESIQKALGDIETRPISLHEPDFRGTKAWEYVKETIDTSWVSTAGSFVERFEESVRKITGAKHAIAVSNGTVALRLALHLVDVRAQDEVIVPPLSFVATANAVSHLGAIPHFVDIDNETLGMSCMALIKRMDEIAIRKNGSVFNKETGRRISAIVPVHIFGNPADIYGLKKIADSWNLPIVEDAAEALGSSLGGKHCGLIGDVGVLSFNGNKLVTTGGGGMIMTNSDSLASSARHLSTTAKLAHSWEIQHDQIGWNDRMPNINAALGLAQLECLNDKIIKKKQLFSQYANATK